MQRRDTEFIGDRIRRLREGRNLSQLALRRLSGLSPTTIYRAEVGGVVTARTAGRLASVLGVSPRSLLEGDDGDAS